MLLLFIPILSNGNKDTFYCNENKWTAFSILSHSLNEHCCAMYNISAVWCWTAAQLDVPTVTYWCCFSPCGPDGLLVTHYTHGSFPSRPQWLFWRNLLSPCCFFVEYNTVVVADLSVQYSNIADFFFHFHFHSYVNQTCARNQSPLASCQSCVQTVATSLNQQRFTAACDRPWIPNITATSLLLSRNVMLFVDKYLARTKSGRWIFAILN